MGVIYIQLEQHCKRTTCLRQDEELQTAWLVAAFPSDIHWLLMVSIHVKSSTGHHSRPFDADFRL